MGGEPENLVLQLLRDVRGDISCIEGQNGPPRANRLKCDMHSLRADVASDLTTLEKRLSDQITGLRRSVMEYHSSTISHAVLITEL